MAMNLIKKGNSLAVYDLSERAMERHCQSRAPTEHNLTASQVRINGLEKPASQQMRNVEGTTS